MIQLKSREEIEKIRKAGKILAEVAKKISEEVREGTRLSDLNKLAADLIKKAGAKPAFLGYKPAGAKKPYPYSICTSINDVVVHGQPTNYQLKSGDLLKLDFGIVYNNYYADVASTLAIGRVSTEALRLIEVTKEALNRAIAVCKPGNTLGDVGYAIQSYVESQKFKVVKELTGHGIGIELHEDPVILNEGRPGTGIKLKPGMVLAIEPMTSAGSRYVIQLEDDSYRTRDGSLSAHFEHTVAITEKGPEILTTI